MKRLHIFFQNPAEQPHSALQGFPVEEPRKHTDGKHRCGKAVDWAEDGKNDRKDDRCRQTHQQQRPAVNRQTECAHRAEDRAEAHAERADCCGKRHTKALLFRNHTATSAFVCPM